ncbi:translocation/assembly module TamB domain-containing protein [Vaginella massiliensis]|uniref:translocation/assembly module TamB domain-containing protein n=1 Tax=Vaginella massiliensis TaxID=1816680 RepID=UPI0037525D4F
MKIVRRIGRVILVLFIVILTLMLSLTIAIQIPAVQTWAAKKAVVELNKTFHTQIALESVDIDFFGRIYLNGLSTKDDRGLEFLQVKQMETSMNIWSLLNNLVINKENKIDLDEIQLNEPKFQIITYKGDSIANLMKFINSFSSKEEKEPSPFTLDGNLIIKNGELLLRNENKLPQDQVWVDAKKLNADIRDFSMVDGDITADVKQLAFETMRRGEHYVVKNLSGKAVYNQKEIRIDELSLQTNDSNLKGDLLLDTSAENALSDFVNKVVWNADIQNGSYVNFKDIRYFATNFDKNSTVHIFGKVYGPLNKMVFTNLELVGEDNYIAARNLQLTNMLDGDLRMNSNQLKVRTSYQKLKKLLPTFIASNLPVFIDRFGSMNYDGNIDLDPQNILIKGNAITGLGRANINALISNYSDSKNLRYKGTVDANNLNLRQITEVKDLGYTSGRLNFDGVGTDLANIKLDVNGKLTYLDLMGKRYQNLTVNGLLKNYTYNGKFLINDPHLKADFDGHIDFSGKPYRLNFDTTLNYIDLDYLGLTKNIGAKIRGVLKGDFSLTNLNDFVGTLAIHDVYFRSKSDTLNVASAFIDSKISNGIKNLNVNIPEYIQGEINGRFVLTEIADAVNNTLVPIVPSFRAKQVSPHQEFTVDLLIKDNILAYFNPDIVIAPDTSVKAYINSDQNTFQANIDSDAIAYGNIKAYNALLNLDTTVDENMINAKVDSLLINTIAVREIDINSIPKNDTLMINANFNVGAIDNPMKFDLNLFHTLQDRHILEFGFAPSTFNLEETVWTINKENSPDTNKIILDMNTKRMTVEDISLNYANQQLLVSGVYNNNEDFKFDGNFQNLVLSQLIPKDLLKGISVDGVANGDVNVIRTHNELKPTLAMTIDNLELNEYQLGNLALNGGYNNVQNVFDVELSLEQGLIQSLYINGFIDNNPETPELNLVANFDDFNIGFVEGFLSSVFANMRGAISGEVDFTGKITEPNFEGDMRVRDLGFKFLYLGTDYLFAGTNTIHVAKEGGSQGTIMLDNITFTDTFYKTKGLVDGAILFRGFSEWFLNLSFTSNNLLVMNTTMKDNDLLYGRVFADGYFDIFGPVAGLDIVARADIKENSELTINTSSTVIEQEKKRLVRFVPEQDIQEVPEEERTAPKGMSIDMLVNAYPTAKINLVLDAATNDMATARGTAEGLSVKLDNAGFNIDGNYVIESGTYSFRQSGIPLLNKDFSIRKGSSINFSGNPLDANLDITAVYERTVSNVGEYLGVGLSQLYDVQLIIEIQENLSSPVINYGIEIPRGSSDMNAQLASRFSNNPDEETMQFVYILMTGKFGNTATLTSSLESGLIDSGADLGLSAIAGALTSLLGGVELDIQYIDGSDQSYTNDKLRYSLSYQINNRLRISGSYGMAVTNEYQENFDGNMNLQYDISRLNNGSLMLNAFTRPTTFGVQAGNVNQLNQSFGAGISYNTSFDTFGEVFKRVRGDERKEQIQDSVNFINDLRTKKINNPTNISDSVYLKFQLDTLVNEPKPLSFRKADSQEVSDKKYLENKKSKRNGLVRF